MSTDKKLVVVDQPQHKQMTAMTFLDDETYHNLPPLRGLPARQISVLKAIAEILASNNTLTDKEISKKSGIERHTVSKYRTDPAFCNALAFIVKEIAKSRVDTVVNNVYKMTSNNVKAAELYLKYTDQYIPRSQTQNLNVNLTQSSNSTSIAEQIDDILVRLGNLGWSPERVFQRMQELKHQGAF